jgi:hypothetical protein
MIKALITDTFLVPEGEWTAISNIASSHSGKEPSYGYKRRKTAIPKANF